MPRTKPSELSSVNSYIYNIGYAFQKTSAPEKGGDPQSGEDLRKGVAYIYVILKLYLLSIYS